MSDAKEVKQDPRSFISKEPTTDDHDPFFEHHAYRSAYDDWISSLFFGL